MLYNTKNEKNRASSQNLLAYRFSLFPNTSSKFSVAFRNISPLTCV